MAGRPFGSKNKKPYKMSPAAHVQRITNNLKTGKHSKHLKEMCNCETCEISGKCPTQEEVIESEDMTKCYLFSTYIRDITDLTQQPLMYMKKQLANFNTKMRKQEILDRENKTPISAQYVKAMEICNKFVNTMSKIESDMGRNKGRKHYKTDEVEKDEPIDIDFTELM